MEGFYTVQELADLLGVHNLTIRRWLKEGKIEGKKFGRSWRISKNELKKILPDDTEKPE